MNSGHVVSIPNALRVELVFGGVTAAYAVAVHEHLSQFSPPSWVAAEGAGNRVQFHPSGRGPKYLERPMNEEVPYLARDLGRLIGLETL
jgi:hypothetical protein